jgi:hypothetical protein
MHQFVQQDGAQKEQRLLPLGKIAEIGIEFLGDTGRYRYGIGVLGLNMPYTFFGSSLTSR